MKNRKTTIAIHTHKTPIATIGWREEISLPDLGIDTIIAKMDTGARTSSLHVHNVTVHSHSGKDIARFSVHPAQRKTHPSVDCTAEIIGFREISDSGGHKEKRIIIQTPIVLAGQTYPIEISLADRKSMKHRMLIGRTALKKKFIIDPTHSFLS